MDDIKSAAKSLEASWERASQNIIANEAAFLQHSNGISPNEVEEIVGSLTKWISYLENPKRRSAHYKISHSFLLLTLNNLVKEADQISSKQFARVPVFFQHLNNALSATHALSVSLHKGAEDAIANLAGEAAEYISRLDNAEKTINEALELSDKINEAAQNAEAISQSIEDYQTQSSEYAQTIKADAKNIEELRDEAHENKSFVINLKDEIEELKAQSEKLKDKYNKDNERLNELIEQADRDRKTIEELLPGAASAGLAEAFLNRKSQLEWPKWGWASGFIFSIGGLLWLAIYKIIPDIDFSSSDAWLHLLEKLPFVAPFVWLGWFCARHYGHMTRVQEDYAFKEAISRAFEGYKKQMAEIDPDGELGLVGKLSENAMNILSKDPLRSFDRKNSDETPGHSLIEGLGNKIRRKSAAASEDASV